MTEKSIPFDQWSSPAEKPSEDGSVPFKQWSGDQQLAKIKAPSTVRAAGDVGLSLGQGAAGAFKALSDLGGADNTVSRGLGGLSQFLGEQKSDLSKAKTQFGQDQIKRAEATGSTMNEVKAYMGTFADQPVDSLAQGIGSFATLGLGKAAQGMKLLGAAKKAGMTKAAFLGTQAGKQAAQEAAEFGFRANVATGVGMGVGAVKGSQFEQTYQNAIAQGRTPEQAQALADEAQRYGGAGTGQQVLGAGLGALASATGPIEKLAFGGPAAVGGKVARTAKGFFVEGGTEGLQGAQERFAGNDAAVDAGVLAPENRMRGVFGQGALEGAIGGVIGGGIGLVSGREAPAGQTQQDENSGTTSGTNPAAGTGTLPPAGQPPAGQPPLGASLTGTPIADLLGGQVDPLQAVLQSRQQPPTGAPLTDTPIAGLLGERRDPLQDVLAGRQPLGEAPTGSPIGSPLTSTPMADLLGGQPNPLAGLLPTTRTPAQELGIDAAAGPLSAAAATAVNGRGPGLSVLGAQSNESPAAVNQPQGTPANVTPSDQAQQAAPQRPEAQPPAATGPLGSAANAAPGAAQALGATGAGVSGQVPGTAAAAQGALNAPAPANRIEYEAEVRRQLGDLQEGDTLTNDMGDVFTVDSVMRNKTGEIVGVLPRERTGSDNATMDLGVIGTILLPTPYTDADGNRKVSAPGTVTRKATTAEPAGALNEQDATPPAAATQTEAAPVEAPAASAGDAAAAGGVPAATGAGDVQADGVTPATKKDARAIFSGKALNQRERAVPPNEKAIDDFTASGKQAEFDALLEMRKADKASLTDEQEGRFFELRTERNQAVAATNNAALDRIGQKPTTPPAASTPDAPMQETAGSGQVASAPAADEAKAPQDDSGPEDYKGHFIYTTPMTNGKFMARKRVGEKDLGEAVGRIHATKADARAAIDAAVSSAPKPLSTEPGSGIKRIKDAARKKALDRIASGSAYFSTADRANEFITKNGLADTHEAVEVKKDRVEVRAKVAAAPVAAPTATPNERAEASTAAAPKLTQKEKIENQIKARADYFTPGNIVRSYGGGHDRVLSYTPRDQDGNWSVRVQGVIEKDGQWVDAPGAPRNHRTLPDLRDLAEGPVQRASAPESKPDQETAIDRRNRLIAERKAAAAPDEPLDVQQAMTGAVSVDDLSNEQVDQIAAMFDKKPAAPAPAADPLAEKEKAAKAKMMAALGDLADVLGKNTRLNITPEQEQKLLPIVIRLFDGAMELGYVKFKQAARYVREFIAENLDQEAADSIPIDTLQGAYIATARRYPDKGTTPKAEVVAVDTIADLDEGTGQPLEATTESADTGDKDTTDDSTPPGDSPALDSPMGSGLQPAGSTSPIRGARKPRARSGRSNDADLLGSGGRPDVAPDGAQGVGDGSGPATVQSGADGVVAGGGVRLPSANYRPEPGGLTREGSWLDTARRNIDLIDMAIAIDKEGRPATREEQAKLSKYVGFGAGEIRNKLFPVPPDYAKSQDPNRLIWPKFVNEPSWKALAERIEALPREWQKSILQSTQYAHYTSENIIRSVWSAVERLGFTGGKVFEPGMGIGSFAMLMPEGIATTSQYTGVEFDAPTALIARLLSPDQNMLHGDFIKRKFPKDFFDVNVGNPPFSQTKILGDPAYEKFGFMLHDFFFAKGIDSVRPGGLQVFVTSKGTMDKQNDKARKYLSERADLIGAIRLPSTAFEGNAGTSVVTDVIFLRKRLPGEAPGGQPWSNLATVETKDGPVLVNEYYAANPAMVLGEQRISGNMDDLGRRINSNGKGGEKYTVVSYDTTPAELDAKFAKAIEVLPENVYSVMAQSPESIQRETAKVDFDPTIKHDGAVYLAKDGTIMRVRNGVGLVLDLEVKLSPKDKVWLADYVKLRDLVQIARQAQNEDGNWEAALKKLNKGYDSFRATHGPIIDFRVQVRKSTDEDGNVVEAETRVFKNKRLYREDYDQAVLTSIEQINEAGEIVKGPFLLGRTIGKPVTREVKSIGDALAVSLDNTGIFDIDDVARRMSLTREEAVSALDNQVYQDLTGQWLLADEYLSGNVVGKLEEAEEAARLSPAYERNVEALKKVQPEKLGPSQISAKLGASWIPATHVNEFAKEIGAGAVTFDSKTETWQVDGANLRSGRMAGAEYGTAKRSPSELLESALNSRSVKIQMTTSDKKTVTDEEGTLAANEAIKKIKAKFKGWVWTDTERAAELVEGYNKRFNNLAPRVFDGSHLTLPGVSLRFKLHPHQLRAILRQVQTGDTYLAHAVGSGKTIEMIAGGMEQKRLGLIQKPMYVVPNHMLEQFSNEFMELYPLANIMVADDENFSADRRKAFIAAATLNAPDAIVITHDAYQRIGVKEESVEPIRDEIISDLEIELSETAKSNDTRVRRSQLEQQIEAVGQRFDRIISAGGKDATIKFEDMGVDFVYVDEAHAFRKLDFHTGQQIKGIDPSGSKRALDMYVKTRILQKKRPGRAMVFATGTPVTNTMGELYTIMRFFAPKMLDEAGISSFDAWARQFAEVAPALEQNAAGKYELVERFSKFDNVPELMSRVRAFMDVLTSEHLGSLVKRPDLIGGKPNLNVVQGTPALKEYMEGELATRIAVSKAWKPSPNEKGNPDPIVSIITDGRFAALDPRFFGQSLQPGQTSILTEMAAKVVAGYKAYADTVYLNKDTNKPEKIKGGTQIVFYNLGFGEAAKRNRGFDSRAAFTKSLTDGGIPRAEIAWFDDANTDAKKEAVFKDMRSGKLKVLIGSAKKMGTGVNVQIRLRALHYQDPPWYPSDVEQPHGRIIRQGNQNPEVNIEWYTTKGTYQSTMWQMVGRKQRFIDQAFMGDKTMRSMDDLGEASLFEQAAAVASGDPRALQLAGLKQDVERLERLQAAHASEQVSVLSSLRGAEWYVRSATSEIKKLDKAFKSIGERYFSFTSGAVDGATFTKPGEFGQAIKEAFNRRVANAIMAPTNGDAIKLGDMGQGIEITMEQGFDSKNKPVAEFTLSVEFGGTRTPILYAEGLGADVDAVGLSTKMRNAVNGVETELRRQREILKSNEADTIRLKKKLGAPFEHQQEMLEKYGELKALEEALRLEGLAPSAQPKPPIGQILATKTPDVSTNLAQTGAPEANATDVVFSRATGTNTPSISTSLATQIVDAIKARWANAPEIVVVSSMDDTAVPKAVRDEDAEQRSQGASGDPEGFFYGGKVYVVSGSLNSPGDVVRVLLHESLGHYGLRGVFGDSLAPILNQIATMRRADVIARARQYGLVMADDSGKPLVDVKTATDAEVWAAMNADLKNQAAEEVLAFFAQTRPELGFVKRAIAAIRAFLRKNIPGFAKMTMTDEDVIANYILPARAFVERGRGRTADQAQAQSVNRNVGDAPAAEAQRVQAAIEGKGLIEAARFLTQSSNQARAAVAQKVVDKLERLERAGVDLKLNIVHRGDMAPADLANSRGYTETGFDEKGRDLAVWLNGADVTGMVGVEEEVLLHELVHAATTGMAFYGQRNPNSVAGKHARDLMAVTDAISAHITQRFADADAGKSDLTEFELDMRAGANNAFRSDDEVLAWALSNAEAQQYLEGIPYKSGSMWSSFVQSVRTLLGLSPANDTALSEVLRVADRLMTEDAPQAGRAAFWQKRGMRMVQQQGRGSLVQRQERAEGADSTNPDIRFSRTANGGAGQGMNGPGTTWDAPANTKWDDYVRKLQDKNIDLKRVTQGIVQWSGALADNINTYLQEELYHGRTAKRVQDFSRMEMEPALKELAAGGYQMEDLEEFMHARHAKEANAVMAERNPTRAMIDTARDAAKAEIDRLDLAVDNSTGPAQKQYKLELKAAKEELKRWTGAAAFKGTEAERNMLSGMSNQQADAYIANLPAEDARKLGAVAAKMDAIMADTSGLMVAYGLESQATVDGWAAMYQNYIPLHREDKEDTRQGTGQGFSVKGRETRGRTGSLRKVVDVVAHIAAARERTIVRGEKNRVAQALVGMAVAYPNEGVWKVGPPEYERVFNPSTGKVENRINPNYKSLPNVLIAKVAGPAGEVKEVAVTFNEDNERAVGMAAALKNLDAAHIEGMLGTVQKMTRYFASINTQYNPIFGIVNLVRDVQGAMMNLGTTPIADKKAVVARDAFSALLGIYQDVRATRKGGVASSPWSQLFEQFQKDGGQTGFRALFETTEDRTNELRSILNPDAWAKSGLGKFFTADGALLKPASMIRGGFKVVMDWLSDYNEAMESAVRLASYKAALDKGLSREQAASIAKNITVNFNRKGQVGNQVGAVYAFFNAAMQGTARMGDVLITMEPGKPKTMRLSKLGKKVVAGGVTLGVVQALVLAAAGFDDEEPPLFLRERSLIFPTGWTGIGSEKGYVSIPMPLGLHVIPGIGRMSVEFALGGFQDPAKHAARAAGMFLDAFNPIGNAGLSMQTLAPTVLDPLVALTENKDWTGKPIARMSFNKDLPGFGQHKDTASVIAKFLAESINTLSGGNDYVAGVLSPTPDQIDYLIDQVTGGVGRELSKVEQSITGSITGEEVPVFKVPLVGRFVGNASGKAGESSAFYANSKKLNRLETEIKGLREAGKVAEAAELRRENPGARLIVPMNMAERQVQKLRRQKSELVREGGDPERVRQIEDRIATIMSRMNSSMRETAPN